VVFHWAAIVLDCWLGLRHEFARLVRPGGPFGYAWRALPGDLLGLVVMRGCGIDGPTREVASGGVTAVVVEDPRIERWFRAHLIPVQAQTLGHFVFSRGPMPPEILAHECEHIRQWSRFGPFYLPLYFGSSALASLRGRRPYWDNAFEAAARRRADSEPARRGETAVS
jgi:hypothetical protein